MSLGHGYYLLCHDNDGVRVGTFVDLQIIKEQAFTLCLWMCQSIGTRMPYHRSNEYIGGTTTAAEKGVWHVIMPATT